MIKKLKKSIAFLLIMCLFIQGTNCFVFAEDRTAPTQTVQQTVSLKTQDGRNFVIPAGVYFIPFIGEVLIEATGAIIVAGAVVAVGSWLYNTIMDWLSSLFSKPSEKINWDVESNRKNHIINGTGDKHLDGWKKLGLDPKKPDDDKWKYVLGIIKMTVDNYDSIDNSSSSLIEFVKKFEDRSVELVVTIYKYSDGTLKLSDAVPYVR